MIQIYCGDGKGKTSAAVGAAVRAAGQGMKVYFCQFMKGNPCGEISILKEVPGITVLRPEKQYPFYKEMNPEEKKAICKEHDALVEKLEEVADEPHTMIILDELIYPVKYHLIDETRLNHFLESRQETELIITGRDPWQAILDKADCVTECKKIKHHFDRGIPARKGIEY